MVGSQTGSTLDKLPSQIPICCQHIVPSSRKWPQKKTDGMEELPCCALPFFFFNLHSQENSRPLTANAILLPALSRQVEWTCLLVGNRWV